MHPLMSSFENGTFNGLGKPERVIETLLSKLFFFDDTVYKVYKREKAFYGDLSDGRFRREFYRDDFAWNNTMAPSVYRELGLVEDARGSDAAAPTHAAGDYYILMRKIDDSKTLFNLLKRRSAKREDLEKITREMFARVKRLTEVKRGEMSDLFTMPYRDLDLQNLETTRQWLYMSKKIIPRGAADAMIDDLSSFVARHGYFSDFDRGHYLASIDNHSGNILYDDGEVNFIDSMPPMRIWRIQSDLYTVSRPATDVEVLAGKELADTMYSVFESVQKTSVDQKMRSYLQCVAALIQAPYLEVLGEGALAERFWSFAKEKAGEL